MKENKGVPLKHLLFHRLWNEAFDHMDHNKLWKHLKSWEYQTVLPVSWETCIWDKKQQLEPYMEQLTGSKWRKENDKAVYCHPYLTYTQSTSWEMLGWISYKLESRLPGEISTTSDMQIILLQ